MINSIKAKEVVLALMAAAEQKLNQVAEQEVVEVESVSNEDEMEEHQRVLEELQQDIVLEELQTKNALPPPPSSNVGRKGGKKQPIT